MSSGAPRYDRYHLDRSTEWLMQIGPTDGRPILFVPPLFEELNRTRALIAATMSLLGQQGFECTLLDLPGCGESQRALEECEWIDWTSAVCAVAEQVRKGGTLVIASVRGGALLDDPPDAVHWRLSPVAGRSVLRDLDRAALTGGSRLAGYPLSASMVQALARANPPDLLPCRTVRLASDPKPADAKLDGPALWRRSEPGASLALAKSIAEDLGAWACANC